LTEEGAATRIQACWRGWFARAWLHRWLLRQTTSLLLAGVSVATEEDLIRKNFGLSERGVGSGEVFSHVTGAGHVAAVKGAYDDCINVKHNTLLLLISEVSGGVNGSALRFLTRLAHQARSCCEEAYLDRAGRVTPFFVHHARAISRAAAVGHGNVLLKLMEDVRGRAFRMRQADARLRDDAERAGAFLARLPPPVTAQVAPTPLA